MEFKMKKKEYIDGLTIICGYVLAFVLLIFSGLIFSRVILTIYVDTDIYKFGILGLYAILMAIILMVKLDKIMRKLKCKK